MSLLLLFPSSSGGVVTINASTGAFSWTGTTSSLSQLINSDGGHSLTWSGTTATFSQVVSASVGGYTWVGTTASFNQLVSAGIGSFSWTGTTSTIKQLVSASVGSWSWSGTTATFPSSLPTINATVGTWSLSGSNATFSQVINSSVGAYSWAGTTANFGLPSTINASVGVWNWAGIAVTLSIPTGIQMPNVTGLIVYEAMQQLQQAGIYLPLSVCGQWPSMLTLNYAKSTIRAGWVSGQSIAAGTLVSPNTPIILTVSQFPFGSQMDSTDWRQ